MSYGAKPYSLVNEFTVCFLLDDEVTQLCHTISHEK